MTQRSVALLVATMDTKSREALYIADCIKKEGIPVKIMDDSIPKPLVFISTLGTTEACVQNIRRNLEEKDNEVIIFHTIC